MNLMQSKTEIFVNWHWLTFSCGCNMKMTHEASQREFSNMTIVWPKVSRLDSHIYWHLFVLNQSPLTIYAIFASFIHHLIQEHICENVWRKGLSVDNFVSTLFLHCICLGNNQVSLSFNYFPFKRNFDSSEQAPDFWPQMYLKWNPEASVLSHQPFLYLQCHCVSKVLSSPVSESRARTEPC